MLYIAAKVDIGAYYDKNDDRAMIDGQVIEDGNLSVEYDGEKCLAAICDGVGGELFGNEAAECVLNVLSKHNEDEMNEEKIIDLIKKANDILLIQQSQDSSHRSMATTLAGVSIDKSDLILFNVGDSRVYRFRNKYLSQLSKDHSLVQNLIDDHMISQEDAYNHPNRNVITRYLGHVYNYTPNVKVYENNFINEDIILICSDGLSDVLSYDDFEEILIKYGEYTTLNDCCNQLVSKAIDKGSQDNISVILIRRRDINENCYKEAYSNTSSRHK